MKLSWGCRQQTEERGGLVAEQGVGWGWGLNDEEEGGVLEMELREIVSSPLPPMHIRAWSLLCKDSMGQHLCKVVGNCRVGVPGRSPSYWHVRCLRHLKGPTSLRVARGKHIPLQKTFTPFCLGLSKWFLLKTVFLSWPARNCWPVEFISAWNETRPTPTPTHHFLSFCLSPLLGCA